MKWYMYKKWIAMALVLVCISSAVSAVQAQGNPALQEKAVLPPANNAAGPQTGAVPATTEEESPGEAQISLSRQSTVVQEKGEALIKVEELSGERTRNSIAVKNEDGSISRIESAESIHYKKGGKWLPIDTTLRLDRSMKQYTYSMLANEFNVRVNNQSEQAAIAFQLGNESVLYEPLGMNAVTGAAGENILLFEDAWASTDMRYEVDNDELKMELVLKDNNAPKNFSFIMRVNQVTPKLNADGSIDFVGQDGGKRFRIPRMWVKDQSSSELRYDRLKVNLRSVKDYWILDIALNNKDLVYPVIIDPTTALIFDTLYAGGTVYFYDIANRLRQTASPSQTVDYYYDRNGNLIRKQPSDNLLVNGSFELDTYSSGVAIGWGPWRSGTTPTVTRSSERAAGGTYSHKVVASNMPANHFTGVYQQIKVNPNKAFTVSSQLRIDSLSNAKVQLYVDFLNAQHQYIGYNVTELTSTTNNSFITVTGNGTTPAGTAYAIVYIMVRATAANGSGQFYTDLAQFQYHTEVNLIANPEFETTSNATGPVDGWSSFGTSGTPNYKAVATPVSGGARTQQLAITGMPSLSKSGIQQAFKVAPGQPYNRMVRLNIQALTNAKVFFDVDYYNAAHQLIGTHSTEISAVTNGKYQTIAASGTTASNAAYAVVRLYFYATAANAGGTAFVDAVEFQLGAAANKLSNGGFENFTGGQKLANSWSRTVQGASGTFGRAISNYSGNYSQFVMGTGMTEGQVTGIYQDVRIGPNVPYTSNVKLLIVGVSQAKVQWHIEFFNQQNQSVGLIYAEHNAVTAPSWWNFHANHTTPAGTAYARVSIHIKSTGSNGSGGFYVDAASFQ